MVLLASILVPARVHAAAQAITLIGVRGTGGDRFADTLEIDLGELYQVVPAEVYRRTAERMGKRGASPEEVHAVCASLRLDALIAGAVNGNGAHRTLVIVTRAGNTGAVVARKHYDLSRRTLAQLREEVMRDIVLVLDSVSPVGEAAPPPVAEETPPEPEDNNAPSEEIAAAPTAPRAGAGEGSRRPFYFGAGAAILGRRLSFDAPGSTGYRGTAVGSLAIEGGVFPLAFSPELAEAHPVIAAFGLAGTYERAFSFTSSSPAVSATSSHASRWSALLVARIPAGKGGAVTLEGGFQRVSWSVASQAQVNVPDVSYALIDFGLSFEHTLGTRYVELGLRAAALGMVDAGNITGSAQYGPATGGGVDVSAGLTIRPTRWLWLRAGGGYTPLFLSFRAAGGRLAHRASDQFADGVLEAGFAL